jgi:hypothetical protein
MRFRERLEALKLYKREEGGGRWGWDVSVMLHCQISDLTDLLVGVGISQLGEEW